MKRQKKLPFFSIKWKALLVFGVLLIGSHYIQYIISQNQLIAQFESQRTHEQQYQLSIAKKLIKQSARLMEQSAETIPLFAQNLGASLKNADRIVTAIDLHWDDMQTNWGLTSLYFYDAKTRLKGRWGEGQSEIFSLEKVLLALQLEKPSSFLSCAAECYQVVYIPTLSDSQGSGLLVFVRSLADIIINFEDTTNIDIAILRPTNTIKGRKDWPLEIMVSSHPAQTALFIEKFQKHYLFTALLQNEVSIQSEEKTVGARLFQLSDESSFNSPYLLLITDLTEHYRQIERVKKESFYVILIALAISTLLLFTLLIKQAKRVIAISSLLPALSQGGYRRVRDALSKVSNAYRWSRDELDLLDESTLLVTGQLEEGERVIHEKTNQLALQNRKIIREHAFINDLLDTAPVIILTQTVTGKISSINRQGCELLQTTADKLIGRPFEEALISSLSIEIKKFLNDVRVGKLKLLHQETTIKHPQQGIRTIAWVHKYLAEKGNDAVLTLSIGQDVTEQKEAEDHLIWVADHDPLTNLFNRRRFQIEFEQQLSIAERYQKSGAILYFDLDQFKYINDTSGHTAGDELLQKVSEILQQFTRTSDTLARLGGDEFALLIPETDAEGVTLLAQKILEKLKDINFHASGNVHNISASVGISLFPEQGSSVQDFMTNADLAMYQAKESGRGKWYLFCPEEQTKERLKTRILWKEKIEKALKDERFILHYQPILDIKQGVISHAEALVRMLDENGNLIMPDDFIPTAEQTGLINQLDIAVLKLAFDSLRALRAANNPLTLSVNLSGRALGNPVLIKYLKEELNKEDVDAEKIIFEVTETMAVANLKETKEMMIEIKKSGARFALDDFGVGYASFYHLRQLPVDFVKIDGSFIHQLTMHKEDQILVQALVDISKVSGKLTIAEFVEDQPILDLIDDYGVDYAQGYHIAKPSAELPS